MSDIISQLQALIQDQSFFMTNAIGVLALQAPPCDFNSTSEELIRETQSGIISACIAKCARDINKLIETVPTDGPDAPEMNNALVLLDSKRKKASCELEKICKEGDIFANKLQKQLNQIAAVQLESRSHDND